MSNQLSKGNYTKYAFRRKFISLVHAKNRQMTRPGSIYTEENKRHLRIFSPVTGLSYIVVVLLQELIVFSYRIQVYCASTVYSVESAT